MLHIYKSIENTETLFTSAINYGNEDQLDTQLISSEVITLLTTEGYSELASFTWGEAKTIEALDSSHSYVFYFTQVGLQPEPEPEPEPET